MERPPQRGEPAGRRALRALLPLVPVAALAWAYGEFFRTRDGLAFLEGLDVQSAALALFPLAGLTAFVLVWAQVMIGSSVPPLARVYRKIVTFHRFGGVFALLFALLHPTLLIVGVGVSSYLNDAFITPDLLLFVWLGRLAAFLILITALAALTMRLTFMRRLWRRIHVLNYAVFAIVWVHSWVLGTDVRSTSLRWLWLSFLASAVVATAFRVARATRRPTVAPPPSPERANLPPVR